MNENHARLCPSPEWAAHLQQDVLPSLTSNVDLGEHMLEIGPGPGAATDWLRHQVRRLTVIEIDDMAGAKLADRYAGSNVEVVTGDATDAHWPDESFDSVGCFTMLHHVPTTAAQNKILAAAFRMLKPSGVLIASDSLASDELHHFHVGDTYNPIEPASALVRLQTVGFGKITVTVDGILKFVAHKPAGHGCTGAEAEGRDAA
jgi:ubiquinone/menaquinone biosynthesis C-methylase UbiE